MSKRQGLWLVIVTCAGFFLSWWNRYVAPTSGGEAVMMASWATDYLPYRDFFYQAPPGLPMLVLAIQALFGPQLFSTLTFGAVLRVVAAGALFLLVTRVASPSRAAIATVTAITVSSTDASDTPFYYNHLSAAFVVIGTYLVVFAGGRTRAVNDLAGVCGGVLLVFAVAIKQTMIFGALAAVVASAMIVSTENRPDWRRWTVSVASGMALIVAGCAAWLVHYDLLASFQTAMLSAPDGKGGILRSLLRPLMTLPSVPLALTATMAAWTLIALLAVLHVGGNRRDESSHVVLVLLFGLFIAFAGAVLGAAEGRGITLFLTALGWWGSIVLAVGAMTTRCGAAAERSRAIAALGLLSFGIGYSFAVSWPLFENAAFPGLALVLAVSLQQPPPRLPRTVVIATVVVSQLAIGVSLYRKFTFPYAWGFWFDPPIYHDRGTFTNTSLGAVLISLPASDLFSVVERVVRERSAAAERMFVFPNMPLLYAIADRRPATYALAHWVDVCPDAVGRADAARLLREPPRILVIRDDPPQLVETEEVLYRGGRPSSVRDVIDSVATIRPMYETVAVVTSGSSRPISVLVRKDAGRVSGTK
jgi:hypothetical protein